MAKKSILSDTPNRLIKRYADLLKQEGIAVEKIILFGSYAKGTQKPWSDLDICVISREFGKDSYEEMVKLQKLTRNIDPMIEPHPYHPKDLNNRFDPLIYEIKKWGKAIKTHPISSE